MSEMDRPRGLRFGHLFLVTLWLLAMGVLSVSTARAQSEALDKKLQAQLREAIVQLEAEADELEDLKNPNVKPTFSRPHSRIGKWDFEKMGPVVLLRMNKPFTGNSYRDTYIRWHLMYAAIRSLEIEFEKWKETGEHAVDESTGKRLVSLIQSMPPEIDTPNRPEYRYEPADIARRYFSLHDSTRVRVGIPPFGRDYYGQDALPYTTGARRAQIEAALAEMATLKDKFKTITDPDAIAFNRRLASMRHLMRQYRGELIYSLLQTGDPAMVKLVAVEINRQINNKQRMGIDMMRYLYVAMYDGYLLLYDENTYKKLREDLKQTAKAANHEMTYLRGKKQPPGWMIPKDHNFADLAFHMTQMLDFPVAMNQFRYGERANWRQRETPQSRRQVTSASLTLEDVRSAIARAVDELYAPRPENEDILPQYRLRSEGELYESLRHGINSPRYQEIVHETGNQALISWAMLASGESFQNPQLYRRISFVLASDTPFTFDRAMRMQMLSNLSPTQWEPWVNRDRIWLSKAMEKDPSGVFAYEYNHAGSVGGFNNANAQYGLLGLWAAKKTKLNIPDKVWHLVDTHWRADQHSVDKSGAAGWSIGIVHGDHKIDPETALDFYAAVQGPMTAAGAATLSLTERYLYSDKLMTAEAAKKAPQLHRAIRWLDQHFSLDESSAGSDWFYYMWTIQRVAQANGIRSLNDIDTFRDITVEILNRQSPDGLWRDPAGIQGKLMSTGYALLYLTNAVGSPVGISKIEFEGNWNNRPFDLWNFVEYASDQYEVPTVWQIVDLKLSLETLLESPILYLSTDKPFKLSDRGIQRLREYLNAGGMLVLNPEKASGELYRAFEDLTTKLYPDWPMEDVSRDHLFYSLHTEVSPKVAMKMVHNGIRPLVVQMVKDIGKGLQGNLDGNADGFDILNNLYLFTVGMNPQRVRLETHHLSNLQVTTIRNTRVARIDLGPGSDPEPSALEQLKRFMAQEHAVNVKIDRLSPTSLADHRMAFLTVQPGVTISDADAKAINQWLEKGGTLWMDAAGGHQASIDAAFEVLEKIRPGSSTLPLAYDSPILTGKKLSGGYDNKHVGYRFFLLREMGPFNTPRLQTVKINERPAIIFSAEDLTTGLAGFTHWDILGYNIESARQLVANGVLDTMR